MLEIQALSFKRQSHTLFENLHFQAKPGSLIQVMGENGSGKTTLLRILAGFLAPSSGKVSYYSPSPARANNARATPQQVRGRLSPTRGEVRGEVMLPLAYLGHNNALKPALTVRENLLSHANLMGIKSLETETLLNQFNLAPHSEKLAYTLSAGQQRKLGLINLFLSQKPIWLLDEPLVALDQSGQEQFKIQLTGHLEKGGMAVVVTHQVLQVSPNTTQILTL